MLSCIRCNEVLDKGEKFCHLCGGLGVAVSQGAGQIPEQKRDTEPPAQNEQNIITYWLWIALLFLFHYLAAFSLSSSLKIFIGDASRFRPRSIPITPGCVVVAVLFAILGLALCYIIIGIMADLELKNTGPAYIDFKMIAFLTTFIMVPAAFFISSYLGVQQIQNRSTDTIIEMSAVGGDSVGYCVTNAKRLTT